MSRTDAIMRKRFAFGWGMLGNRQNKRRASKAMRRVAKREADASLRDTRKECTDDR